MKYFILFDGNKYLLKEIKEYLLWGWFNDLFLKEEIDAKLPVNESLLLQYYLDMKERGLNDINLIAEYEQVDPLYLLTLESDLFSCLSQLKTKFYEVDYDHYQLLKNDDDAIKQYTIKREIQMHQAYLKVLQHLSINQEEELVINYDHLIAIINSFDYFFDILKFMALFQERKIDLKIVRDYFYYLNQVDKIIEDVPLDKQIDALLPIFEDWCLLPEQFVGLLLYIKQKDDK